MKEIDNYFKTLVEFHKQLKGMIERLDILRNNVNEELGKEGRTL